MTREQLLMDGISKSDKGLEIAPYHAPLAPKGSGYNCRVLDVFDAQTLRGRAAEDPHVDNDSIRRIEQVDYVGSATDLIDIIPEAEHGTFDYIVSSHNFEHLPDPIRFLQGVEAVLRPGGRLVMAVPDVRACFDFFRPGTELSEWLSAYREKRGRPTPEQVFSSKSQYSVLTRKGGEHYAFSIAAAASEIEVKGDLDATYEAWRKSRPDDPYEDAHCTVFTPSSLRLLLEECRHLQLIGLDIDEITGPTGCEFHVRLSRPVSNKTALPDNVEFQKRRTHLMRMVLAERCPNTPRHPLMLWFARTREKIIRHLPN